MFSVDISLGTQFQKETHHCVDRYTFEYSCLLVGLIIVLGNIYRPQRSWGKVIFSEACVKNSVHGGGAVVSEHALQVT